MRTIKVNSKFNNKKLSEFLYANFNGLTKNTLYKAFRKKDIRINNIKINEDTIVHVNDEITIYIIDDLLFKNINIENVFEDQNILIINKPIGIEVTGDSSITHILQKQYSFISPCHRLDRNTGGLLLFAKNENALNILLSKFKHREIEKHYLAMVYGIPRVPAQKLKAYLFKDNKKHTLKHKVIAQFMPFILSISKCVFFCIQMKYIVRSSLRQQHIVIFY